MFAEERQQEIIKMLYENGAIKVNHLSKTFRVTEETIRRDLEKLEVENKLKRTHGGAIVLDTKNDDEIPFKEREVLMAKEKQSIANEAAKLVEENDVIFLDASSTALYVAKALPNIQMKVLTNSLIVAFELSKKTNIEIILTGGNLVQNSFSLIGPTTIQSLKNYYVNKMFLSCKGFDFSLGISDSNEQQAAVKRTVMERSEKIILMADHSKINKKSFVQIGSIDVVDIIIVDDYVSREYFSFYEFKDKKIIYSKLN
ncbi:DeoR/GlpR family DNA-binding transcription regulator [Solibacillus sp. FSL W7-1464]|uniref:DeoR/GlpR family DNA-binding transcription regulator n=1 Tax=Solibacillus sp. FSL W7-1464 TaxID=2921706 RepID=UPI0030F57E3C